MTKQEQLQELKTALEATLGAFDHVVENCLPTKGDTSEECQKMGLINASTELEHLINGLEVVDLELNPGYPEQELLSPVSAAIDALNDALCSAGRKTTPY